SEAAGIGGNWDIAVDAGGQVVLVSFAIKQNGDGFTATMASHLGGGFIEDGVVSGDSFKGTLQATLNGEPASISMSGKLEDGKLKGTMDVPGFGVIPFT